MKKSTIVTKEEILNKAFEKNSNLISRVDFTEENYEVVEKICESESWEYFYDSNNGNYIEITIEKN